LREGEEPLVLIIAQNFSIAVEFSSQLLACLDEFVMLMQSLDSLLQRNGASGDAAALGLSTDACKFSGLMGSAIQRALCG
jgi:hypothetical protein